MFLCRMIAKGRVQGVNYRSFVCQHALALGITGHVKNLPDDTVEILAEAKDRATLDSFKKLVSLKTNTPWGPYVDELVVESEDEAETSSYSSFEIAR